MKDVILVGIQGSGKGTQGKKLIEHFAFRVFETGAEFRRLAKGKTPIGKKIKKLIEAGNLVPNEITMEILENFLKKSPKNVPIIFDGVPRLETQRKTMEALLQKYERDFEAVELVISQKEAVKRLLKRAKIEGRKDDNPESIKRRIANYFLHTEPLLVGWRKENRLLAVHGEQPINTVFKQICKTLCLTTPKK